MYNKKDHTFAICAYKESPYLEECLQSLVNQEVFTNIIITTSTPNDYILNLAKKYNIETIISDKCLGIGSDFNFAYESAKTPLVTIAHQDDVYYPSYTKNMLDNINKNINPLIFFSDYDEFRNKKIISNNNILLIKKIMLYPLRFRIFQKSIFVRRRILSFGNPICCPCVTFVKDNLTAPIFNITQKNAVDYSAWASISLLKGEFVYQPKSSMFHRIHEDSQTTKTIVDSTRTQEELEILQQFWPKLIANFMSSIYKKAQKSNKI